MGFNLNSQDLQYCPLVLGQSVCWSFTLLTCILVKDQNSHLFESLKERRIIRKLRFQVVQNIFLQIHKGFGKLNYRLKILALVYISKLKLSYRICLDEMQMFHKVSLKLFFKIFRTIFFHFQPYNPIRHKDDTWSAFADF